MLFLFKYKIKLKVTFSMSFVKESFSCSGLLLFKSFSLSESTSNVEFNNPGVFFSMK